MTLKDWMPLIAVGVASLFVTFGWAVVHITSKNRDLESWRRTTIAQATAEFLDASYEFLLLAHQSKPPHFTLETNVELQDLIRSIYVAQQKLQICNIGSPFVDNIFKLSLIHTESLIGFALLIKDEERGTPSTEADEGEYRQKAYPDIETVIHLQQEISLNAQREIGIRSRRQTEMQAKL